MRQARKIISTYSADAFGVCSALYELGGMTVMHDASGCNSTYTTHDEPRWYHTDSMVFISGLTEMDAILGNDQKLIEDILETIDTLHPKFAAIAGTPIPMMTGFDYDAISMEIENASGIPCFGFTTNGMRSYLCGASEALEAFARRMTNDSFIKKERYVNILGATPLDFSLSGTVESIQSLLEENGWTVNCSFAMNTTLDDISHAGDASVNLVISSVGMKAAKALQKKFGTPYVVGTPIGELKEDILLALAEAEKDGQNKCVFDSFVSEQNSKIKIIGESVTSRSLAAAIAKKYHVVPQVIYSLEDLPELSGLLSCGDIHAMEEEEIENACKNADIVIADPLYRPILPENCNFYPLPHEAFSGRMYRKEIPNLLNINI